MASSSFSWIFNVIASFIGVFLRKLFSRFLPEELSRQTIDISKDDEIEITSFSGSRRYDVFPSFSGEDVRKSLLSHFLKELDRRLIHTFIDHGIERSRPIGPELLLAIRESRIAIVVFSKKYASSTWCLNELVEIHKCYQELNQMVIPIFYNVDPSQVRKQTGEFGKVFNTTCKGKPAEQKQRWMQALADVANLAGEDLRNWPDEAAMIGKIANDLFNKLITPSDDFGDLVGIEAHLKAMNQILCLGSKEARMVGILGPSGIGKTTIARALFSQLSSQFHHRAFVSYKRTLQDDYGMRLCWQEQFLSDILCQKNIKIEKLGVVEQMLKHKKVLIVLDDVDDLELLKTLVGQTGWFGPESQIIVITQDRRLLNAHEINNIYEVDFPSNPLALRMLCRSAFGQNSPHDGFMVLAVEVAELAGNLPLGLNVLGSSLRGMGKDEWVEMLPRLRNDLDGKIEKTLRVSYDRLDRQEQQLFLYIAFACLSRRNNLSYIKDLLGDSVNIELKILADKSLIRITPKEEVEMHNLLQKLARETVRAESIDNPGKRRYLVDVEDIRDVFTDKTGTETVLGIYLKTSDINQPLYIDKKSFKCMCNLQFLIICNYWGRESKGGLYVPQGLAYLPRKLRLLDWNHYPCKCLPSNFKAEFLVKLRMENSKLEKLWEGTQPLGSLKRMNMSRSRYLKEISDLSNAINLEELDLSECESLVTLPSSIQSAIKLRMLNMQNCTKLESLPILRNLESLEEVNLKGCLRLRNFPKINLTRRCGNYEIRIEDCLWNKNLHGVDFLHSFMRCIPSKFLPEHILDLTVRDSMIGKLWEGVQSLGSLQMLNLSNCGNLKEFPDLSKATNLRSLELNNCKSLVTIPSTSGNLRRLWRLEMKGCTGLEVLPTDVNMPSLETLDLSGCKMLTSFPMISLSINNLRLNDTAIEEVPCTIGKFKELVELEMKGCTGLEVLPTVFNLSSLKTLDLSGCKRLRSFPMISWRIIYLYLHDTAIEEVPCWIEYFSNLTELSMRGCKRLKNISPNIFRWRRLERVDFSECVAVVTALGDASVVETTEDCIFHFMFNNCINLDGDTQELILRSYARPTFLPGGRVPNYFTYRASTNSLTVTLPQSSLSQEYLGFKACIVLEPITYPNDDAAYLKVCWIFRDRWQHIHLKLKLMYNTDHLLLVPLKFPNIAPPSDLGYNDVTFEFSIVDDDYEPSPFRRIRGCGIRVLEMSPSPASSDGSKKPRL